MKTNRRLPMLFSLLLLATGMQEASAFYNPQTGRWLSRDPVGEKGGKNLFSFTGNSLPNLVDPLGLVVITAHNEIIVSSGYDAKRVLGPPKCACSKTVIGTVQVRLAYVKATTSETMNEEHHEVLDNLEDILDIPTYSRSRAQSASFLGAGFIVDFTPNDDTKKCCKKTYWKQWKLEDEWVWPWWRSVLRPDYTARNTAADFAGDNVNQLGRDRDWHRSYILELHCDKEVVWIIPWSYRVIYHSGVPDDATVTLDAGF